MTFVPGEFIIKIRRLLAIEHAYSLSRFEPPTFFLNSKEHLDLVRKSMPEAGKELPSSKTTLQPVLSKHLRNNQNLLA